MRKSLTHTKQILILGRFWGVFGRFLGGCFERFWEVFGKVWGGLGEVFERFWEVTKSIKKHIKPINRKTLISRVSLFNVELPDFPLWYPLLTGGLGGCFGRFWGRFGGRFLRGFWR